MTMEIKSKNTELREQHRIFVINVMNFVYIFFLCMMYMQSNDDMQCCSFKADVFL